MSETWPKKPVAGSLAPVSRTGTFICLARTLQFLAQFPPPLRLRPPLGRLNLSPASCVAMSQSPWAEKKPAPLRIQWPSLVAPSLSLVGIFDAGMQKTTLECTCPLHFSKAHRQLMSLQASWRNSITQPDHCGCFSATKVFASRAFCPPK